MKKLNIKFVSAVLLALLFLEALPITAMAATPGDVVLGNNYTLDSGQTLNNDLFVLGGNVDLKQGSTVIGNVFIIGGNAQAAGTISGNLLTGSVKMTGCVGGAVTATLNGSQLSLAVGDLTKPLITGEAPVMYGGAVSLHR